MASSTAVPRVEIARHLAGHGCPACRAWSEASAQAVFGFLYENVTDPQIRERIEKSYGFCRLHTWQLYRCAAKRIHSLLGPGLVYRSLTGMLLSDLFSLQPARSALAGDLDPCYMCALVAPSADAFLKSLVRNLSDPEIGRLYQESDGLCLRHAAQALARIKGGEAKLLIDGVLRPGARVEALVGVAPDADLPMDATAPPCSLCEDIATATDNILQEHHLVYCRFHSRQVPDKDAWAASVWAQVEAWLPSQLGSGGLFRRFRPLSSQTGDTCPVCQRIPEWERELAQSAPAAEVGCFRHIRSLVKAGRTTELSRLKPRLEQLAWQLGEFCRKHDHRFIHEPWGPEQYCLQEAIPLFAGSVDLTD